MTAKTKAAKTRTPKTNAAPTGPFLFFVPDGQGGWREATHRDLCINEIAMMFAANGHTMPPAERARAAAAYDAAAAELSAPLLDRAA